MNSCIYQNVCKDFNTPLCETCEYHISYYKPRRVPVRTWYPYYRDVTAGDSAPWVARFIMSSYSF